MRLWSMFASVIVAACALPSFANASELSLSEVLRSLAQTHPKLEIAQLEIDVSDADIQASKGAFDPSLNVKGKGLPFGYYRNMQLSVELRQPTPFWGLTVSAGYRAGWGEFPSYKGQLRTFDGGEIGAGFQLPLWRDRAIDRRRAAVQKAKLGRRQAQCGVSTMALELTEKASIAYWKWVEAGKVAAIQRELLELAKRRDAGLAAQAAEGSIPAIVATDNRRLVLSRRRKYVEAEAKLNIAAIALSLYLRDETRKPKVVNAEAVPERLPELEIELASPRDELRRALAQRPESCELEFARKSADVDVRLRRQQRAPSLELSGGVSRDLGRGPAELGETEVEAGLVFKLPLLMREARGKHQKALAKRAQVTNKIRLLHDQIAAELATARTAMEAAQSQSVIAREQLALARQLADAEQERLDEGASSLVVLDLREIAAAEAARQYLHARTEVQIALARYLRASASRLGVVGRGPRG